MPENKVWEYLPEPEDRLCYYRTQAYSNSTDNEEYDPNKLAFWWLAPDEDHQGNIRTCVSNTGDLGEADYHRDMGIRPALYVKVAD